MAEEIERKFLVDENKWKPAGKQIAIKQAYLSDDPERTVRIRIAGDTAELTIKGKTKGITREEFNYTIPVDDATELLKLAKNSVVEKIRHLIKFGGKTWEVDVFTGANSGLIMAEIELNAEKESIKIPDWVGKEVSGDSRFYNSFLSNNPYSDWRKELQ